MNSYAKYHTFRGFAEAARSNPEWVKRRQRCRTVWAVIVMVALIWTAMCFAVDGSRALKVSSLAILGAVAALGIASCLAAEYADRPDGELLRAAASSVVRVKDGRIYRVRWQELPSPEARFDAARFEAALSDRTGQSAQVQVIDQVSRLRFYGAYVDVVCAVTMQDQTVRRNQRLLIFRDNPDFADIARRLDNRYNNVS
jgi:hypothetical protein